MARGTEKPLAPALAPALITALAMLVCAAAPASAQDQPTDTATTKPSLFGSIWSGLKRAVDKPASGEAAAGAAQPPAEGAAPAAPVSEPPSLSAARWIGFTPALVGAEGAGVEQGAWIAGPFSEAGATGWVTDTVSGLTVEVRLVWREAAPGSLAELSAEAGRALGLAPGAITNVTVYLAR